MIMMMSYQFDKSHITYLLLCSSRLSFLEEWNTELSSFPVGGVDAHGDPQEPLLLPIVLGGLLDIDADHKRLPGFKE